MSNLDKAINDAKSRLGDLERKLAEARDHLQELQCFKAGVKVGDTVIGTGRNKGRFRVTRVALVGGAGKPWLHGHPERKDGSFGTAVRALFSHWEKP